MSNMTAKKDTQTPMKLIITADSEKLIQLCDLLSFARKRTKARFSLCDSPLKLVSLDVSHGSTSAGKTTVRIYPSDRFLNLAATFLTRQFNLHFVQIPSHKAPPK